MEKIELTLYIAGDTPRSKKAVRDFMDLCKDKFKGAVTFGIIDVLERSDLARKEGIILTPTLVKMHPARVFR